MGQPLSAEFIRQVNHCNNNSTSSCCLKATFFMPIWEGRITYESSFVLTVVLVIFMVQQSDHDCLWPNSISRFTSSAPWVCFKMSPEKYNVYTKNNVAWHVVFWGDLRSVVIDGRWYRLKTRRLPYLFKRHSIYEERYFREPFCYNLMSPKKSHSLISSCCIRGSQSWVIIFYGGSFKTSYGVGSQNWRATSRPGP